MRLCICVVLLDLLSSFDLKRRTSRQCLRGTMLQRVVARGVVCGADGLRHAAQQTCKERQGVSKRCLDIRRRG